MQDLARRRLGNTGQHVSIASLGAGGHSRLGQTGGASFEDSVRLVREALDLGITMVDTAPAYGTEEIVGVALAHAPDAAVSTKAAVIAADGAPVTAVQLRASLEGSLSKLRRERVDVFYLHGVAPNQYRRCREDIVPEMLRLRQEGKLAAIGITERFASDPGHAMLREAAADPVWDVLMVGANYLNQTAVDAVIGAAASRGVGIVCMYALRGTLGDAVRMDALVCDLVRRGEVTSYADWHALLARLPRGASGLPNLADMAYRFCSHIEGVSTVLTGSGKSRHLVENVRSIAGPPLQPDLLRQLRQLFGRVQTETGEVDGVGVRAKD